MPLATLTRMARAADKETMAADRALQSVRVAAEGDKLPAEGSDPFADVAVPAPLEESLARHRRHLAELVRTMKTAGISDRQIEESVCALIELYKRELIAAIRRMRGGAW